MHDDTTHLDLILGALRRFKHRVAFKQDDVELTYAQMGDSLARWAKVFHDLGVRPGDGFGLLSPNRPEVCLGQIAPALAGGRYTALHPMGSLEDHLYMCREAELRFLLVDPAYEACESKLLDKSNMIEQVLSFGPSRVGKDINGLASACANANLPKTGGHLEQLSGLVYTGGTTGVPSFSVYATRDQAPPRSGVEPGH